MSLAVLTTIYPAAEPYLTDFAASVTTQIDSNFILCFANDTVAHADRTHVVHSSAPSQPSASKPVTSPPTARTSISACPPVGTVGALESRLSGPLPRMTDFATPSGEEIDPKTAAMWQRPTFWGSLNRISAPTKDGRMLLPSSFTRNPGAILSTVDFAFRFHHRETGKSLDGKM